MTLTSVFAAQRRGLIFVEMLAFIFALGLIDFAAGCNVSVFLFYGCPILIVAWYCDRKLAILTALIAGLVWWWADIAARGYHYSWLQLWETAVRLGFFMFAAAAGSALREHNEMAQGRIALLEYSQQLEHEIVGISEREQRRIGQDLHDGICQNLAALACASSSLRDDLEKANAPDEARVAAEVSRLLQETVVQTRDLARGLVPVPTDEGGLASALENLAGAVSRLQGVTCRFESTGPFVSHQPETALHLYRIAQEAINNATRHGEAQSIALSLDVSESQTTLRVADDGHGISRTQHGRRGMGLSTMSHRAHLSGGEFVITEPTEGGTVVTCTVPTVFVGSNENVT